MTGSMSAKLVKMCATNFDSYGKDLTLLGVQWMQEFQKYPDDLMETAVRGCISFGEKFPTIFNIREAIRDLQYVEETKPKQLAWDVKRTDSLHKKIMDMATGKTSTKEYLATVDITKLGEYARVFFPAISNELVIKNYPELSSGLESQNMCHYCRTSKQACNNVMVKHELLPNGFIKNTYQRCEKVDRRV